MSQKIVTLCILLILFSCKKNDKLFYTITREDDGVKKVQYLCEERKTGKKYILEYIGDTILDRKYFTNSKFRPEGESIFYDKNGNIEQKCNINTNGNIDGLLTFYYPSGKISEVHHYNNGVKGLQEYYLENGFLKCVYYFDVGEKLVHKKNIILENGMIKDTVEELYAMIRLGKNNKEFRALGDFAKDTVSLGEEFSIWFKRPKSKYISDKSQWLLVYDIQKINANNTFRDPTNELELHTFFEERKIRLFQRGLYLLYYDVYKDTTYLCSNEPLVVYVK